MSFSWNIKLIFKLKTYGVLSLAQAQFKPSCYIKGVLLKSWTDPASPGGRSRTRTHATKNLDAS